MAFSSIVVRRVAWFILLAAFVAAFAAGIYGVVARAEAAVELVRSDDGIQIVDVKDGGVAWYADIETGDAVIQINGSPASEWAGPEERIYSITVEDSVSGYLKSASGESSLVDNLVSLGLLSIIFVSMSMLLLFRARPTSEITAFAFLAMVIGIGLAAAPASIAGHYWARNIQGMAVLWVSVFFTIFSLVFGRRQGNRRWIDKWAPEAGLTISALTTVPWIMSLAGVHGFFAPMRNLAFLAIVVSLVVGLAMIALTYRRADADTREQIRIAGLGTLLGFTPFLWLSIIPQVLDVTPIVRSETSAIGFGLIPLSFGYAIMRHQMMGIRQFVHRGTAYALITGVLIIVFGTILLVLDLLLPNEDSFAEFELVILVIVLVTVPSIAVVRRKALAVVDRMLYKSAMERPDIISAVNSLAGSIDDLPRLLQRTLTLVGDGMELEFAWFFTSGDPTVPQVFEYRPVDRGLMTEAERVASAVSAGVRQAVLPQSEYSVIVGTIHGVGGLKVRMLLGPKASDELFTDDDNQFVQTVCGILSTAAARIQLMAEVKARTSELTAIGSQIEHIQEDERAEISSYLHDEPLQKVAYALAQMRERSLPDDLAVVLEEVARDLRSTAASLSPDVLREAGLLTAVKWLITEQKRRNEFNLFFDCEGIDDQARFPESIELAAYRVIQEGLNNCRKHANAKAVWIRINLSSGTLNVSVEDNGVGIARPAGEGARSIDQGLGIRALKQRITSLGGTLILAPRASRGMSLNASIPVADQSEQAAS